MVWWFIPDITSDLFQLPPRQLPPSQLLSAATKAQCNYFPVNYPYFKLPPGQLHTSATTPQSSYPPDNYHPSQLHPDNYTPVLGGALGGNYARGYCSPRGCISGGSWQGVAVRIRLRTYSSYLEHQLLSAALKPVHYFYTVLQIMKHTHAQAQAHNPPPHTTHTHIHACMHTSIHTLTYSSYLEHQLLSAALKPVHYFYTVLQIMKHTCTGTSSQPPPPPHTHTHNTYIHTYIHTQTYWILLLQEYRVWNTSDKHDQQLIFLTDFLVLYIIQWIFIST